MNWIVTHMKWIMVASGTLTLTMVYAAVSPRAALLSTFGEGLDGPLAELIVRNWGVLIALIGGMLIYGAYDLPSRNIALLVGGLSKLAFITLVLSHGERFLAHQAGVAVAVDTVMVVVFAAYLAGARAGMAPRA